MFLPIMFLFGFIPLDTDAQILKKIVKKVEAKAKERGEQKADVTIDKGLDKAEQTLDKSTNDAAGGFGKKQKKSKQKEEIDKANSLATKEGNELSEISDDTMILNINTDYDFVSGNKTIFSDQFIKGNIGDFPAFWNTNGSGEIVTFNDSPIRYLKIPDNTLTYPETNKSLPENFTIEFDLLYPTGNNRPPISFGFSEHSDPAKNGLKGKKMFYFLIQSSTDKINFNNSIYSKNDNLKEFPFSKFENQIISVAISVNKSRVRLYLNQVKIFDLPKALEPNVLLRNNFHFRASPIIPAKQAFYISNIRIAESGIDLRSQLLAKGKTSTTAIHFEVNSSVVKSQSTGAIREIAMVMQNNSELRIRVVGHTDSDGEKDSNLQLSQSRADAIKKVLITYFKIDGARIEAVGEGENEPVNGNETEEQKFQNRRVEFIKI